MSSRATRSALSYSLVGLALLILVTKVHAMALPSGIASQIGHNSEALAFALLVCAEIQFFRPWALGRRLAWLWTVLGAGILFAAAYGLLQTGWTSSVVTLNEPIVGAGFVLLYIMIPRPFRFAPLVSLAILAFIVIFFDTAFVLDQAESLVPFLIAPLALDVFDRTILEPDQPDRPVLRVVWIGVLAVVGLAFMASAPWAREDLEGWFRYGIDYGQRASEAYWGWILVHAYFAYVLGRLWHPASGRTASTTRADRLEAR
ncbi:hypothetical protein [Mumia sp. Pv 4-285]|uniref:hypothetical protein n=1 Tax=Mumia qirimensis TaxID=3234852 RepID=UPI00351CF277